ncbi:hypothetical protein TRSC58_03657 [Trypanosoma rangeli SC58]|uniref:Uncharacterized protein n=1 Tax=Trypanosoma rangeli SC58 TaxID=429131 RepID=A0A061J5S9_TRYRA|nr:hypothetical protein TRSC58_03657 [Trypanosoma rangeli SC58]
MEHLRKIRFWHPRAPVSSGATDAPKPDRPALVCHDETVDYAAYHLCVLDPILGNLLCVGDNVPVVVLTRGRRRVTLPVQKGVRWLDAHIFVGTSSFLLLSPERLLLFDFTRRHSPSALFPCGRNESLFACLHVPQGMTWGVVGCRGGSVMYWKLKEEADSLSLVWAALTTDLLTFCRPFLPTQRPSSSSLLLCGHVHSIDSNPTSSNSLVAVLSGVPGVCKWHLDENSLSGFYRLPHVTAGTSLQACRVTPGGTYIIATKSDLSTVFIWSDGGKKAKDRSVEVFWTLETGCRLLFLLAVVTRKALAMMTVRMHRAVYTLHAAPAPPRKRNLTKSVTCIFFFTRWGNWWSWCLMWREGSFTREKIFWHMWLHSIWSERQRGATKVLSP